MAFETFSRITRGVDYGVPGHVLVTGKGWKLVKFRGYSAWDGRGGPKIYTHAGVQAIGDAPWCSRVGVTVCEGWTSAIKIREGLKRLGGPDLDHGRLVDTLKRKETWFTEVPDA